MKRLIPLFLLLLLLAGCGCAAAEVEISFTPEHPRAGDYVDVTVTPGRADPQGVVYTLTCDGEEVFSGKAVEHYAVSFRPRQEGTWALSAEVTWGKDDSEKAEIAVPVSGIAPPQEDPDVVYSQKDGWWYKKKYSGKRDLQKAGCAIFALSHALQRMGISDESVTPEQLAKTYSYFYVEGRGTYNAGLIGKAAQDYDFLTVKDLITSPAEIADSLRRGDLLSFSIVDGHIALADGISEDGTKVRIVDSAPGATYERIRKPESIFVRTEDGTFKEAPLPESHPGIRWFFETQEYGGMIYWMDIDYCAERGMRLIRQQWLKAETDEGLKGVSVEYAGALVTKVVRDGKSWRVPTASLVVSGRAPHAPRVALVTAKKGTWLLGGDGKRISGKQSIKRSSMVLLLSDEADSWYAWYDGDFGYLDPEDVTVLPEAPETFETGIIVMNGNSSGALQVTVHLNPDKKSTGLAVWKTGTPVAVVEKQDSYLLMEAKGRRGWVHEKYFQPDEKETEGSQEDGQKIDEGE